MRRASARRLSAAVLIVGIALVLPPVPASAASPHEKIAPPKDGSGAAVSDGWIVTLKPDADAAKAAPGLARAAGGSVTHVYRHALHGFAFKGSAKAAAALLHDPNVRTVVSDHTIHATADTIPSGISRIQASHSTPPSAFSAGFKGAGIRIAILDTGIDLTHPDLVANIDAGLGLNCMGAGPPQDGHGHGTHVAGIAAAAVNGLGVVGVAPSAHLVPIKVLDDTGSGEWSNLICAIDYLTGLNTDGDPNNDVRVANMSLGDTGSIGTCTDGGVREAICRSVQAGVVYTAAAGNSTVDASTFIPAAFPEVITVSALTDLDGEPGGHGGCWLFFIYCDDTLAEFSNYGAIDVTAPGTRIYSDWTGGGYQTEDGTSMAAPHVAGVAALVLAVNPKLHANDVEQLLRATGECPNGQPTDGPGKCIGKGQWTNDPDGIAEPLVNALRSAQRAATWDPFPTVKITNPTDGSSISGSVTVTATAADDKGVTKVDFSINGTLASTDGNGVDGWSFVWNTSPLSGGTYALTATATDTAGQTDTDQVTVQVGTNVKGTWVGTYGVDGYLIGAWNAPSTDLSNLPAGVTYSLEQGTRYSWTTATTTTDVRALQSPDQTERRATTWYDTTEVRVRLNFANPYSGTLHLYAVDWNAIGRAENITVDDGAGPRTVGLAAFNNGAWVHVPITVGSGGSVVITAHNTAGTFNAVLNGLFLGGAGTPPPPPPPPPPPTTDIPGVKGTWVGTYGVGGYLIGAWNAPSTDLSNLPAGVTYSLEQGTRYSWTTATTTTDVRALQSPDQTERRATTWYDTTEVRVRLNFANPYSGTLHLYAVDWNAIGRAENITVDDGAGPRTVGLAAFNNGAWVHVPITVGSGGSVVITAHNTAGTFNAVLNGLFLGGAGTPPPPPPPPPPPTTDIPGVKGTWVGTYGVDGYLIGAWNAPSTDLSNLPAGVTYSLEQGTRYSWTTATTTTDVRALQSPDQTERRATTWYDTTEVRVRLNFANPYSGTLHLYAVDWNAIGRAENITVDDGAGPRTVGLAAFNNGAWVHVPITVGSGGSVVITAHNTAGTFNAVLNGLFLGGAGTTSGISLAKSANPTTYSAVGQTITYGYTITNTGNVSLGSSQFTVSDDHIGSPLGTAFSCGAPVALAPNATVGCTKSYTISQADLNAGSVTNKATASGAGLTSNQATATATAAVTSGISLAKSANPTTYSAVGQTITYGYTITNTGNVSLGSTQFTVSDDHIGSPLGTAFSCGAPVALAPNATVGCTKSYTISQADLNAGSVTNKATASGAGLTSNQATATATAAVTSGISLAKSANPTTYSAVGQTITYGYTITNTGNVSLGSTQFTVSDDHIGSPLGTAFSCGAPVALAPNATVGCTKSYTISQADLNAGSVTNKATASGAGLTSNQATATATAAVTSGISLAKSANPTTYSAVGQTITYGYTITNTGNVSLGSTQFTVSDDHIGSPLGTAFSCGAPVALAPNATVGCTKSYTISQADLNAGSVTNKATASGAGLTSNQATATATAAVTVPSAPRNLTAARASTRGVQLSWSAPVSIGGAATVTYNVYRGTTAGGENTTPIAVALTSTTYLDNSSTLVTGTRYFYKVAAVNAAGRGPFSNEASARAR